MKREDWNEAYYGKGGLATGIIVDQLGSFLVLSTLGITVAGLYSSGRPTGKEILRRIVLPSAYDPRARRHYEQMAADKNAVGDNAKWMKEQDVCIITLWNGLLVPSKTPSDAVVKLNEAVVKVLHQPEVRKLLAEQGSEPVRLRECRCS